VAVVVVVVLGEITKLASDVLVVVPGVVSSRSKIVFAAGPAIEFKHKIRGLAVENNKLAAWREEAVPVDGP
jgi:hypothetical protein